MFKILFSKAGVFFECKRQIHILSNKYLKALGKCIKNNNNPSSFNFIVAKGNLRLLRKKG